MDLVEHIVPDRRCCADDGLGAELEEVRPAVGILQRDVVGQDGDRFGWSGLTKAYRSVLSAAGSLAIAGASLWDDMSSTPLGE